MTPDIAGRPAMPASQEQIPDPVLYWVGLYLVTLEYGGPDEGGHWYPAGELETDPALYRTLGHPPRAFFEEDDADHFLEELETNLPLLNAGRPPLHASTSRGLFEVHVMPGLRLPPAFPVAVPRYA